MTPYLAMQEGLSSFHLLRPYWLWALLLLPPLLLWWRHRWRARSAWRTLVDPHLLAHLIEPAADRRTRAGPVLAALAYIVAVLALAGPSWRQSAQPLWETRTPLVVALDLSSAMRAGDLPPSRLAQARAKLAALLQARDGGPVALVAYAGDAFTVAPLTDDAANVALFLDALDPEVMPVDGDRADRAIELATELLQRAGAHDGDIVLMTGQASSAAIDAARAAASRGYRVGALGLGSAVGAPYPTAEGTMGQARLDAGALRQLASAGNGHYAALSSDTADLQALGILRPGVRDDAAGGDRSGMAWQDDGYWLLPLLMLLALFAFRRRGGMALALLACLSLLPWTPAHAQGLWRRADQAAHDRLESGNQAYRRGDFAQAAKDYAPLDDATGHYNRGNALAKAGRYPEAIAAYDQALRREPGMPDALANKRAVEAMMKRPPSSQDQEGDKPGQGNQGQQAGQGSGKASSNPGQKPPPSPPSSAPKPQAGQPSPQPPKPADAKAQEQADAAQRERMQRALQQGAPRDGQEQKQRNETPQERERRLANEAWLRRVPDDPGGLLRAKFRLEYERRQAQGRAP
jgi:Ca-activated chloride channel family protein